MHPKKMIKKMHFWPQFYTRVNFLILKSVQNLNIFNYPVHFMT